jgi:DNA-binding CsgD family transcriptional regulator
MLIGERYFSPRAVLYPKSATNFPKTRCSSSRRGQFTGSLDPARDLGAVDVHSEREQVASDDATRPTRPWWCTAPISYVQQVTTTFPVTLHAAHLGPEWHTLSPAAEQSRLLAFMSDEDLGTVEAYDGRRVGRQSGSRLVAQAASAWRDGRLDDTLEFLWAATCRADGDRSGAARAAFGLAPVFAALGQFDDAEACLLVAADEIGLSDDPAWVAAPHLLSARVDLLAGRLDKAITVAHAELERAAERGPSMLAPIAFDVLASAALWQGELGDAAAYLEQWRAAPAVPGLPFATPQRHWAAARLRDAQGEPILDDGAAAATFDLLAHDRRLLVEEPGAPAWLVRAADGAGDAHRVAGVVATMARLAATNERYPTVVAAAAHAIGLAERDPSVVEQAVAGHRSPWARASATEDVAVLWARKGDRAVARSWLERAAADYTACGAGRDLARSRQRLRRLGVRPCHWSRQPRPVCGWESLTETERVVAGLVAEGLSNQQVAARMFLSRHTVDFHLRHIFRKLGIDSRVVLARMALAEAHGHD